MDEKAKSELLEMMYYAWKDFHQQTKDYDYARGYLAGVDKCLEKTGYKLYFYPLAEDGENPFSIVKKGE